MDDQIEHQLYLPDDKPFNIEFSLWTAMWWRWLHSFPKHSSPALDSTGELCSIPQVNSNVWFLAGTLGGSATRTCSIPRGKAILFPIITSAFSFAVDPHLISEDELIRSTIEDIDTVKKLSLTVDDHEFKDFAQFRVRSEPFDDIIFGQPTRAVSDGYGSFLKALIAGKHKIHFLGENVDFFNEVTYCIYIKEDNSR